MLKNLNILENYSIKAIRFITPVFHHSDENLTSCSTCPTKDLVESEISSLSSLSLIFLFRIFFLNLIKFSQFFLSGHDESLHRFFFDFCFDFLNDFFFWKGCNKSLVSDAFYKVALGPSRWFKTENSHLRKHPIIWLSRWVYHCPQNKTQFK